MARAAGQKSANVAHWSAACFQSAHRLLLSTRTTMLANRHDTLTRDTSNAFGDISKSRNFWEMGTYRRSLRLNCHPGYAAICTLSVLTKKLHCVRELHECPCLVRCRIPKLIHCYAIMGRDFPLSQPNLLSDPTTVVFATDAGESFYLRAACCCTHWCGYRVVKRTEDGALLADDLKKMMEER